MFLKTKEVAEKLSVTKMTISTMVKKGKLNPVNSDKRYFLFEAKEIDCLILKRQSNE
ncbi:helix-turn-helix domain-containing protein [Flavobacterium taihuense]|uniref:Helix-turn-helix domain-containing protein n=1 Tax=Flavobacterium taihuense TaxID=2857508 RepID=A0ABS6XST4_9FLAO|nr:helix-turn-helix domain-containing protein [Flavobacterium taihuense]